MQTRTFEPFPGFQTPRLRLRVLRDSDRDALFALRSDPQVLRYLPHRALNTPEQAAEKIASLLAGQLRGDWIIWALCRPEDETMMGTLCLWNFNDEHVAGELGYDLLPAYWGWGYMTEAIAPVLDYGFEELGLRRIDAWTHPDNGPSRRLLERLAFARAGESSGEDTPEPFAVYRLERQSRSDLTYTR